MPLKMSSVKWRPLFLKVIWFGLKYPSTLYTPLYILLYPTILVVWYILFGDSLGWTLKSLKYTVMDLCENHSLPCVPHCRVFNLVRCQKEGWCYENLNPHVGGVCHIGKTTDNTHSLPWASCQIRKNCGCACAGNAGNVFPAVGDKRSRHASRHVRDARAVIHAGIAN